MGLLTDHSDPDPPRRFRGIFSRPSTALFGVALALALVALSLTLYQREQRRVFAEPTATAMGEVRSSSGKPRKDRHNELFCWVSYEFTPAAGGPAQRNWRFWRHGCGVSPGRPIHIQYVIARPEVNRPIADPWTSSGALLWFAAGVMVVIGTLVRTSRE